MPNAVGEGCRASLGVTASLILRRSAFQGRFVRRSAGSRLVVRQSSLGEGPLILAGGEGAPGGRGGGGGGLVAGLKLFPEDGELLGRVDADSRLVGLGLAQGDDDDTSIGEMDADSFVELP